MAKFKIGDTVKIVRLTPIDVRFGLCMGDVGKVITVVEGCSFGEGCYAVVFLKHYYDDKVAWNSFEGRPAGFVLFGNRLELVMEGGDHGKFQERRQSQSNKTTS
jgi:hypothetical protein